MPTNIAVTAHVVGRLLRHMPSECSNLRHPRALFPLDCGPSSCRRPPSTHVASRVLDGTSRVPNPLPLGSTTMLSIQAATLLSSAPSSLLAGSSRGAVGGSRAVTVGGASGTCGLRSWVVAALPRCPSKHAPVFRASSSHTRDFCEQQHRRRQQRALLITCSAAASSSSGGSEASAAQQQQPAPVALVLSSSDDEPVPPFAAESSSGISGTESSGGSAPQGGAAQAGAASSADSAAAEASSSGDDSSDGAVTIDLQLPRRSLLVQFTCNVCNGRSERLVNPVAWQQGLVSAGVGVGVLRLNRCGRDGWAEVGSRAG